MRQRAFPKKLVARRRGAVVVLVAVCLGVLMSVLALSVDGGRMYVARRHAQVGADAAADAAAMDLYTGMAENDGNQLEGVRLARIAAYEMARLNGFANDGQTSNVTVHIPPVSGSRAGQPGFVEVQIERKLSTSFAGIFGFKSLSIRARSVAAGTQVATQGSVLVLDPKAKKAFEVKGSASQISATGDIIVNSRSKKAVSINKHGQARAEHFLLAGGIDRKSRGFLDGEVQTGVVATPDPLATLPPPPKGPARSTGDFVEIIDGRRHFNLPPGTYKEMSFDKDDLVVMQPGVFYVDGGRMELKGHSDLQANQVMIYTTGKRGLKFDTRGSISITPPVSGPYRDVSLFQDRASRKKIQFRKSGHLDIHGIVYAPNAEVKFNHVQDGVIGPDLDDEEEDVDDEADNEFIVDEAANEDSLPTMDGSISASFISRKLKIDKHSRIQIRGNGISAMRPFVGVVE